MFGLIFGLVVGGLTYYGLDHAGCVGMFSGAVALGAFVQTAAVSFMMEGN